VARQASKPEALPRAVELLAARDRTEREILQRLIREGYADVDAEAAVAALKARGMLDDAGTASRYARSRLRSGTAGTRRIRARLEQRGAPSAAVAAGVAEALGEIPEAEALDALVQRRWPQQPGRSPEERVQRLAAFLLRRGFPAALVASRLQDLIPGAAEALAGLEDFE
jgi:regulatory protein